MKASRARIHFAVRSGSQLGFTLIELIITITLVGIMAVVGSSVIADTFRTTQVINRNNALASEARYAMERMAREIREIKYTGSAYSASTLGATSFVFTRADNVTVTLTNTGSNLTLAYGSAVNGTAANTAVTLSNKVDTGGLTFTYFDVNDATATAATLRFIRIELSVVDTTTGYTNTLRTRVAVRNS